MDESSGGGIQHSEHGQRDSDEVYAHGKRDRALNGPDRCIAEPLQIRQFGDIVIHQCSVGGIYGDITAHCTHCDADIGCLQSGSVIYTVADHADCPASPEQRDI